MKLATDHGWPTALDGNDGNVLAVMLPGRIGQSLNEWIGRHSRITGPGIPDGTRIVSIQGDLLTLSAPVGLPNDE